jgi:hypothetical protein
VTVPRRSLRHRPRPLLEQARAPRPTWRLLFVLPLLFIFTLMGVKTSAAWFTSTAPPVSSPAITSGSFSKLMDVTGGLSFTGTVGGTYSGSITVTSKAEVSLPINATWQGPIPGRPTTLTPTATNINPENPGKSVTFSVGGTYSDWTGALRIAIGSNNFDWVDIPVTVSAQPVPITDYIVDLLPVTCQGGYNGQKDIPVMEIARNGNAAVLTMQVSVQFTKGGSVSSLLSPTGPFTSATNTPIVIRTNINNGSNQETSGVITVTALTPGVTPNTWSKNFRILFKQCPIVGSQPLLLVGSPDLTPGQEDQTVTDPNLEEPSADPGADGQSPSDTGDLPSTGKDQEQLPADPTEKEPADPEQSAVDGSNEQPPTEAGNEQPPIETGEGLAP